VALPKNPVTIFVKIAFE